MTSHSPQNTPRGRLSGLVFAVTGVTGGIGAAVAREVVSKGAKVVLSGRDGHRVSCLVRELNVEEEKSLSAPVDLYLPGSAERIVNAVLNWKGRLDGLILCAGGARFTFFQRMTKQEFDQAVQLNLLANVDLVREALPHLVRRPASWIVFINSIAARQPAPPRGTAYLAAKAGLRFFADGLFAEARDLGVRVCSILPDLTDTAMIPPALAYDRSTLIRPQSVAKAVVFALTAGADACITEIHLRPQPSLRFAPGV